MFQRAALVLLAVVLFHPAAPADAQFDSATVLGRITDPSGAAVPGTTVTLTHLSTRQVVVVVTDVAGNYQFLNVRVGTYRIEAELTGFAIAVAPEVEVTINARQRVDLALQVGGVGEVVEVTAGVQRLETDSSGRGQVIGHEQIVNLALNGRNYADLALPVNLNFSPAANMQVSTVVTHRPNITVPTDISQPFGNPPRTVARGPALYSMDLGIHKDLGIGGGRRVQFGRGLQRAQQDEPELSEQQPLQRQLRHHHLASHSAASDAARREGKFLTYAPRLSVCMTPVRVSSARWFFALAWTGQLLADLPSSIGEQSQQPSCNSAGER